MKLPGLAGWFGRSRPRMVLQPYAKRRRPLPWGAWLLLLFVLPLALFAGLVTGLGSTQFTMLIAGLVVAPFVLLMPATWLVGAVVFMATIGAGCLQYFARIDQAHWIPTLLLMAMLVRIPFDALSAQREGSEAPRFNALSLLLLGFVLLVLASAAMNQSKPMQILVGFRHYIFPLALVAAVVQARAEPKFWLALVRGIPWLMLIQLPLCLYQFLVVEQRRDTQAFGAFGISWDAVVGSFGGNPEGGGASGALALFLSFGMAATLVLWRRGLISKRLAWAGLLGAAASAALAEVKVLIIFLPLALLLVNRKRVLRSPVSLIGWLTTTVLTAILLLNVYQLLHYKDTRVGVDTTVVGMLERMFKTERDPRFYNPITGEVSRVGALLLWSDENIGRDFGVKALVGWGPAASKISTLFGVGPAVKGKRYTLTTSASTQLLWDLGVLGLLAFAASAAVAARQGLRDAKRLSSSAPDLAALAEIAALGAWLVLIGLFYNGDAINNPAVQALLSLSLGWVLLLYRWQGSQEDGRDVTRSQHVAGAVVTDSPVAAKLA